MGSILWTLGKVFGFSFSLTLLVGNEFLSSDILEERGLGVGEGVCFGLGNLLWLRLRGLCPEMGRLWESLFELS